MWGLLARLFSKLWGKLLIIALPWLRRFMFSSVVKKAGRGVLFKAPLKFHVPNLLVTGITVCIINVINFLITLWYTDGFMLSLLSAGGVTAVTAFFLLRGIFCPHTKRERIVLLLVLLAFFGLFVVFLVVFEIAWLALVLKLMLEVIFCSAVMLVEMRRMNYAQSKAIDVAMRKLRISPDRPIGKFITRFFVPKEVPSHDERQDNGEEQDSCYGGATERDDGIEQAD